MIEGIRKDCVERFGSDEQATGMDIMIAYSGTDKTEVNQWEQEVRDRTGCDCSDVFEEAGGDIKKA